MRSASGAKSVERAWRTPARKRLCFAPLPRQKRPQPSLSGSRRRLPGEQDAPAAPVNIDARGTAVAIGIKAARRQLPRCLGARRERPMPQQMPGHVPSSAAAQRVIFASFRREPLTRVLRARERSAHRR